VAWTDPNRIKAPIPVSSDTYASENAIAYTNNASPDLQEPAGRPSGRGSDIHADKGTSTATPLPRRITVNATGSMRSGANAIRQSSELAAKATRVTTVRNAFVTSPCRAALGRQRLRAPIDTHPKLTRTRSHAALVVHRAVGIALRPPIIAQRIARRRLILRGRRARVLVLVRGNGLGFVFGGERSRRPVDREIPEPHFGVSDALGRLVLGMLAEPATPALAALIRRHCGVVIGAVALLVVLGASLGLFKAGSACN
jgi:hypothetical protein